MSAHKIKYENKIILDLTDKRIDYKSIDSRLRRMRIVDSYKTEDGKVIIRNAIKIGKYMIFVKSCLDNTFTGKKQPLNYLSMNDHLKVDITEEHCDGLKFCIFKYFEGESWYSKYLKGNVAIKDVSNIILFCKKLDDLSAFS